MVLNDFTVRPEIVSFIKDEITGLLNIKLNQNNQNRDGLMAKIEKANSKLKKARNLLVEDKIDAEDFNSIKRECQREIDSSENQISTLKLTPKKDFKIMIDRGLMVMGKLGELYENASAEEKKIILSSTFPKKITFQDEKVRTPEVNKFVKLIYLINRGLPSKKKGTNPSKLDLCRQVELARFELGCIDLIAVSWLFWGFFWALISYFVRGLSVLDFLKLTSNCLDNSFSSSLFSFSGILIFIEVVNFFPSEEFFVIFGFL